MRPRTVRKLSGLEIDEVSLVDRPANQHGLVAFAKADEESSMDPIFDAEGREVDPEQLEHGDVVYAESGEELVFVEDGEPGGGLGEVDDGDYGGYDGDQFADGTVGYAVDDEDREAAGVGKALFPLSAAKLKGGARLARREVGGRARGARNAVTSSRAAGYKTAAGMQARGMFDVGRAGARQAGSVAGDYGSRVARNPGAQAFAGGGAAAGGATFASRRRDRVGKSLGEQVNVALSKALTEDERDAVISKAMDLLGDVVAKNERLEQVVADLIEDRELEEYGEIAKGYDGLPVEPTSSAASCTGSPTCSSRTSWPPWTVFKAASDAGLYDEVGYGGGHNSDANAVLEQVYALAGQTVGKAQGSITAEQAVTAIFEANPAAYDEYEAEQRGLR